MRPCLRIAVHALAVAAAAWVAGCAEPEREAANALVGVLRSGQVAFGSMVQDRTPEGAAQVGGDSRLDFLFYDMERRYDFGQLQAFMSALGTPRRQALLVRVAPVGDDRELAAAHVAELLAAGVDGIVFPHIRSVDDAEFAVGLLRAGSRPVWPLDPDGEVLGYFMIEDREAVEDARAILATPGIGFGAPGQGSLRQAYDGDTAAVGQAVARILSACLDLGVVCAKLVDETDAEQRVREGFRVIMGNEASVDVGRAAAGRAEESAGDPR